MKRWFRRRANGDTDETLARIDERLRKAKAETPMIRRTARRLDPLPNDEFVDLVARLWQRPT